MQQIKIKINKIGAAMAAALALWARDASAPDAQASIGGQAVIEGVIMKGPRL